MVIMYYSVIVVLYCIERWYGLLSFVILINIFCSSTTTITIVLRLFWILSRTTRVSQYQKGKTRKVKPIWIYWSKM